MFKPAQYSYFVKDQPQCCLILKLTTIDSEEFVELIPTIPSLGDRLTLELDQEELVGPLLDRLSYGVCKEDEEILGTITWTDNDTPVVGELNSEYVLVDALSGSNARIFPISTWDSIAPFKDLRWIQRKDTVYTPPLPKYVDLVQKHLPLFLEAFLVTGFLGSSSANLIVADFKELSFIGDEITKPIKAVFGIRPVASIKCNGWGLIVTGIEFKNALAYLLDSNPDLLACYGVTNPRIRAAKAFTLLWGERGWQFTLNGNAHKWVTRPTLCELDSEVVVVAELFNPEPLVVKHLIPQTTPTFVKTPTSLELVEDRVFEYLENQHPLLMT